MKFSKFSNFNEDSSLYFSYEKTVKTEQDKDKQKRSDNSKSKDRKKDYNSQRKLKRGEQ